MKVLSISNDPKVFEEGSAVRRRQIEYGDTLGELHIVSSSPKELSGVRKLSDKVYAYPIGSASRPKRFFKALQTALAVVKEHKDMVITTQDPFETGIVGTILKLLY